PVASRPSARAAGRGRLDWGEYRPRHRRVVAHSDSPCRAGTGMNEQAGRIVRPGRAPLADKPTPFLFRTTSLPARPPANSARPPPCSADSPPSSTATLLDLYGLRRAARFIAQLRQEGHFPSAKA